MNDNGHQRHHFEFADFRLYPHERLLEKDRKRVELTPRVMDLLIALVRHNGEVAKKETLLNEVWAEKFVEEGNLSRAVSTLRKTLGVQANGSDFIGTVPKVGYRFIAPVVEAFEDARLPTVRRSTTNRRKIVLSGVGLLTLAAIAALGVYFWDRENVSPSPNAYNGAVRLTDDPADDFFVKWTQDGRIRFFRMGSDKEGKNMWMKADGTDQTEIEVRYPRNYFLWSPDGTKAVFSKPGVKDTTYIANADGSGEIAMPLMGTTDWSADSKKIVYQSRIGENKNSELFVYSLESGKTANVTNSPDFDADPSFSPDGDKIVFTSIRDRNADIYLMNSDGTGLRRLTDHRAFDNHPAFSPDGTTIAFNSDREEENSDVYLMDLNGGDIRHLTDSRDNEAGGPGSWSPDGTRFAFISNRDGNDDIYVTSAEVFRPQLVLSDGENDLSSPAYSPDGKQIVLQAAMPDRSGELRIYDVEKRQTRFLLRTESADLGPILSPDGSQIVFHNKVEHNTEICLIRTDGSGFTNLTQNSARDVGPTFSADGRQVIFASDRLRGSGHYDLFAIRLDDGSIRQVYSNNAGMSIGPAWSPSGEIVFMNDKEGGQIGNFEIFKIGLDSDASEHRLTFRPRYDGQPSVSPDGKRIAFASNGDGNDEIYIMQTDGSGLLRISRNPARDHSPRWSPDGKRIIFSSDRGGKFAIYEIKIAE